jgi:hypothetical protein
MMSFVWFPRYTLTPAIARGPTKPARARVRAAHLPCSDGAVQKSREKLHAKSTLHLYLQKCIY